MLSFYELMIKRAQDYYGFQREQEEISGTEELKRLAESTYSTFPTLYYATTGLVKEPMARLYGQMLDPRFSGYDEKELLRLYRAGLKANVYRKEMTQNMAAVIAAEIMRKKRQKRD
jgi:hypothetical protein